jgi:hypothetical protein
MSSRAGGHATPTSYSSNSVATESESHFTTDGQSASLSWHKAPIWGLRPDLHYCLAVTVLCFVGAISDERTGLSFVYAAGPCQRSPSRVRFPWYSRPRALYSLGSDRTVTPLSTVTPLLRVTQPLPSNSCSSVLASNRYVKDTGLHRLHPLCATVEQRLQVSSM